MLWLAASISFVGVHAALWSAHPRQRAARYLAAAVLLAIPPFGIVGWAHPVTAAGVLFPGWGWWGLGATVVGLMTMTTRTWLQAGALMAVAWAWSATTWISPSSPAGCSSRCPVAGHRRRIARGKRDDGRLDHALAGGDTTFVRSARGHGHERDPSWPTVFIEPSCIFS